MDWKNNLPKENIYYETQDGILYNCDCLSILEQLKFDSIITDPPYLYLNHKLDQKFDEKMFFQIACKKIKKFLVFFGRAPTYNRWNVYCDEMTKEIKDLKFKEEIVWDKMQCTSPTLPIQRIHELISIWGKTKINKVRIDAFDYQTKAGEWWKFKQDLNRLISKLKQIKTIDELREFLKEKYIVKCSSKHKITKGELKEKDRAYNTFLKYQKGTLMPSIIRTHKEHYNYQHPTQKPLKLMKYLLWLTTDKNDIVLDPFAGSGTTLLACAEENRRWIGVEIDKDYCEIIKNRLKFVQKRLF